MKKILICLLALTLALSFVACGDSGSSSSQAEAPEQTESQSPDDGEETDAPDDAEEPVDDSPTASGSGIATADDLEGKTIGVQQGTTGDIFAEDIEGATIERFNNGADAVMALRQGKVDAVIIDDQPAKVFAEQNDDIMILEDPFEIEDYAICISKEKPELTEAFNGAIAELKADGTLQGILDYYIGGVEGSSPYQSPEGIQYQNGSLTMATNAAFPPYEYWEGGEICGIDADMARAICDKLGYELKIEDMAFDSIIMAVQSGSADFGAAGMTVTETRLQSIDFTDSYCTGVQVIIVQK